MHWNKLTSIDDLNRLKTESSQQPIVIFKHSTRCSISSMALNRMERAWNADEMSGVKPYYLDLIQFRNISNEIADTFDIYHESPQLLVIKDDKCIYHSSHMGINYNELLKKVDL